MSPQWGKCSKVKAIEKHLKENRFSPRNGESVLKIIVKTLKKENTKFQSPQWGKCSKEETILQQLGVDLVSVPAMGKVF